MRQHFGVKNVCGLWKSYLYCTDTYLVDGVKITLKFFDQSTKNVIKILRHNENNQKHCDFMRRTMYNK